MIEMNIKGLMVDPLPTCPSSSCATAKGQKVLPIWVGVFEANAIALQIENIQTPRPMTHDLLRNIIQDLQATVDKIVGLRSEGEHLLRADPPARRPPARSRSTPGRATRSRWRCAPRADPRRREGDRSRQDRRPVERESRTAIACSSGSSSSTPDDMGSTKM
jgi:hypothetical protein